MSEAAVKADWIAVDWGTTRLRVWAMGRAGAPLAQAQAATGMGTLAPQGYDAALLALAGGWIGAGAPTPALVCGMAGAREGWAAAPYADIATPLAQVAAGAAAPQADPRLAVRILPGLKQDDPPEVMRGEETQLAGLLALRPGFEGLVALPGTHCKWAQVAEGRVRAFRTVMTGEMFALLASQSVLRHAMPADLALIDDAAFTLAAQEAFARPAEAIAALFSARAARLLNRATAAESGGRLSGLLIGMELAAASALFPGDGPVTLIGETALCARYAGALAAVGRAGEVIEASRATLAGLAGAHAQLFGDRP